jgi:hypothetical protein
VFGGIPSIREPICPFISNVLVGVLEVAVVCASAADGISKFDPVTEKSPSNNKADINMGTITAKSLVFATKYHLCAYY